MASKSERAAFYGPQRLSISAKNVGRSNLSRDSLVGMGFRREGFYDTYAAKAKVVELNLIVKRGQNHIVGVPVGALRKNHVERRFYLRKDLYRKANRTG